MNSGQLTIKSGKLLLFGEIFDQHGAYPFEGFIDTGCSYDMVITRQLADAVCANIEKPVMASVGGGASTVPGSIRKINVRFGNFEGRNISVFVPDDSNSTRTLIGIGFFQKAGILLIADFHSGATQGGLVTTDRAMASSVGMVVHCSSVHNNQLIKEMKCPFCGVHGEQ